MSHYLPLPSQPQLVLIYRPRRGGRLSRPWCEVAQAEIRTRNLPIANPALYHVAGDSDATLAADPPSHSRGDLFIHLGLSAAAQDGRNVGRRTVAARSNCSRMEVVSTALASSTQQCTAYPNVVHTV